MNFLFILADAVGSFIRRNPILCLSILLLAILSPALMRGIALFVLYLILGIVLISVLGVVWLRLRLKRMQEQMQEQMHEQQFGGQTRSANASWSAGRSTASREGDVKVHRTADTPEKRVSKDVGDYVDFVETKNDK